MRSSCGRSDTKLESSPQACRTVLVAIVAAAFILAPRITGAQHPIPRHDGRSHPENEMRESTRYDTCPLRGKGWRCFSWAPACFPSRCMPLLVYRVMFRVLLEDGWWTRSMTLIGSLVWSAPHPFGSTTQVEQLFRILRWRHVKGHDTTSSVSPAFRNSAHAGCDDVHAGEDARGGQTDTPQRHGLAVGTRRGRGGSSGPAWCRVCRGRATASTTARPRRSSGI